MSSTDDRKMKHLTIHAELRAFLEQHRKETPVHAGACRDAVRPLLRIAHQANAHIAALRAQLHDAEQAAHDEGFDHTTQWLNDYLATVTHRGELAIAALRDFAQCYAALSKALTRPEAAILRDLGIDPLVADSSGE